MTDTVWDYVFYGGDLPQSDIHPDALKYYSMCLLHALVAIAGVMYAAWFFPH